MTVKDKLRNNLIQKIQKLSIEKLTEMNGVLDKIENQLKSKEKTLNLAGSWKDLDDDIFSDLTENLVKNRAKDRQMD